MAHDISKSLNINGIIKYFSGTGFSNNFLLSEVVQDNLSHIYKKENYSDFYALALCSHGQYMCKVDDREYELKSGGILFGRPKELHMLKEAINYKGILIAFTRDFLNAQQDIFNYSILKRGGGNLIQLDDIQLNHMNNYLKLIDTHCNESTHTFRQEIIRNLLQSLIYDITPKESINSLLIDKSCKKSDILLKFEKLLDESLKTEREVQFYADKLFMTPSHLSSVLKDKTGFSAKKFIQDRLLSEIKMYLINKSDSIVRIADEFNFSDSASFIHFFKSKTSMTPEFFRKQQREL